MESFATHLQKLGGRSGLWSRTPVSLLGLEQFAISRRLRTFPLMFRRRSGSRLPYEDECFDLVIARQVMHHANNLPQMLQQISRVLKPGGRFIGIRDHVLGHKNELQTFLDRHPLHHLYGGENAFLFAEYSDAIESSGLTIRKQLDAFDSPINYGPRSLA